MVSTGLTCLLNCVERPSHRNQKERLTTTEDTRWTLDIKQKFKENWPYDARS
jgi:hypothetical protein